MTSGTCRALGSCGISSSPIAGSHPLNASVFTRVLAIYSSVVTTLLLALVLFAWLHGIGHLTVDNLNTQRIDVREPDKTLRLAISNTASSPRIIIKGKSFAQTDQHGAGMIFYNAEGTENGGLIFGGEMDAKSGKQSYGHLSFDAYEEDQTMALDSHQDGDNKWTRFQIVDYPNDSLGDYLSYQQTLKNFSPDQRNAKLAEWEKAHGGRPETRLAMGRGLAGGDGDDSVLLSLHDVSGRPRIVLYVGHDGEPSIQLLDAQGRVTDHLGKPAKL